MLTWHNLPSLAFISHQTWLLALLLMNLPTVLQWEMKMCSIESICIWTPIEHKGKPDWMETLITEYNVICSSAVTWITNQIASCQGGFKIRRQEWYQPGRLWQPGVCLVLQFYTSIPPSVAMPGCLWTCTSVCHRVCAVKGDCLCGSFIWSGKKT